MIDSWAPPLLLLAAIVAATAASIREFPGRGGWLRAGVHGAIAIAAAGVAAALGAEAMDAAGLGAVATIAFGIALVDVRRLLVPDTLVLALACVALAAPRAPTLAAQALGALLLGGLLLLVRTAYSWRRQQEGLGLGDVKLAAAAGFLLGPAIALQTTAAAAVATIAWIGFRSAPASRPAPFGAALAAGTVVAAALSLAIR